MLFVKMDAMNSHRQNIIVFFSACLLAGIAINISAQTPNCFQCGKKISGTFIQADGKYFHADHFICAECGEKISGKFEKHEGKFYHTDCAKKYIFPACDVCGEPLEGRYFQDLYEYRYHPEHLDYLNRCDNCDKLICERITGGGSSFDDGRSLCNLCLNDAVKSESTYGFLLRKVAGKLRGFGVNIDMGSVSVNSVDRIGLKTTAGSGYTEQIRGFCNIATKTSELNGIRETSSKYDIYVLNRIPSIYVESTLAHELMHVWFAQNTKNDQTDELTEGSCHFISYLYLLQENTATASRIAEFLIKDTNPVYGGGLRKVLKRFGGKYTIELLNYLKSNTAI